MNEIKLYTASEAAKILKMNINTVNELIRKKEIKYICLGCNKIRKEWLDEFLQKHNTLSNLESNTRIKFPTPLYYDEEDEELYLIKEVAKIFRMNVNDTNNLINAHLLKCTTFGKRKVARSWINEFLEDNIYADYSNKTVKEIIYNEKLKLKEVA